MNSFLFHQRSGHTRGWGWMTRIDGVRQMWTVKGLGLQGTFNQIQSPFSSLECSKEASYDCHYEILHSAVIYPPQSSVRGRKGIIFIMTRAATILSWPEAATLKPLSSFLLMASLLVVADRIRRPSGGHREQELASLEEPKGEERGRGRKMDVEKIIWLNYRCIDPSPLDT